MVMRSTLRYEPVNCVVTIFADIGTSVSVFNIEEKDSRLSVGGRSVNSRFGELHGSVVLVGHRSNTRHYVEAALVFETPAGRTRAMGTASLELFQNDRARVKVHAEDDNGEQYRFVLSCTPVDDPEVIADLERVALDNRCRSSAS